MLLRHLHYLVAIASERHFARAAESCGVTQPTLSNGIKQLEEELGLLIVRRGQRFEGFTPEGERVLEWARLIVSDAASLKQDAAAARQGLVGRLRLAAIPTALPIVPALTGPFALDHPHVIITVLSLTSIDIQTGLGDFSLDAGVTYLDNEPLAGVRAIPLYRERYFLFTAAGGRFARRRSVSWREAADTPLCLLTPDMQNRRILNAHFREAGAEPRPSVETNSVLTLCAHLRSGQWSSILPQSFLALFDDASDLRALPLVEPELSHSVGLVMPDREPLTPSARHLVQLASRSDVRAGVERAVAGHRRTVPA
ncbi:MAG TPA: LysR substrate-binding domain-containing protein [Gemmatimonadales bacterium]|nr:LysR substrate-binding domain-containing protein [Gemmatimonadales bacterium]